MNNTSMYAVSFKIDHDAIRSYYPELTATYVYDIIHNVFRANGFSCLHENFYFNEDRTMNAVSCILAVQGISRQYTWFKYVVSNIHMLRIEEDVDLTPALRY